MRNKIPADAFRYYLDLGPARTYAAVAAHYGVSLRGVTKRAVKENWKAKLANVEAEARGRIEAKAVEDVAAIDERHLKMARSVQARALETLRNSPMGSGTAAVRALDVAIRIERAVLGRGKDDAPAGRTHAELAEAANAIPPEVAEAAAAAMRKYYAEKRAAAQPPPPAEPVVPPALVPRVYGEN